MTRATDELIGKYADESKQYKGIVLLGAPGTGKTTLARELAQAFPKAKYVEAFDEVIGPAYAGKEALPKKESLFIQTIAQQTGTVSREAASRHEFRNFFVFLKDRYSPTVISKTLAHLHAKRYTDTFLLIASVRGYANALYLRKQGYLLVYLRAPARKLSQRVANRDESSTTNAHRERQIEERLFSTKKIEKIAHLCFDTHMAHKQDIPGQINRMTNFRECKRCVNNSNNPAITIGSSGLCLLCERYKENFDPRLLKKELAFLKTFVGKGSGRFDAMVGISGGKDSTATLYQVKEMGFTPLAFTLDTKYYPKHIFSRSKRVAKELEVEHLQIDIRKYARPVDMRRFEETAELYSQKDSRLLREKFVQWYAEGRKHYSIKCDHPIPFVRSCQLCRCLVIRAYYDIAIQNGVQIVVLGINEWAGLSQDSRSKKFAFSGIRKLQPFKDKPPVYIVHLPFLFQRKISDTRKILKKLGWKVPVGEVLIESNSNSCLFARAAESKARRMLGFHPDASRLSREVTVGFITKAQAKKALEKVHRYRLPVGGVLKEAGFLKGISTKASPSSPSATHR